MTVAKKILVTYLFSKYDSIECIKNFVKNYNNFPSGAEHDLLICLKKIKKNENIYKIKEIFGRLKCDIFFDEEANNDYDWGSYYRISKIHKNRIIFFMNCHSYPIKKNWLFKFISNFKEKTILAPTASHQSSTTSSFNNFYFKSIKQSLYYGISNFRFFPLFPNPHLRSNSFMINSDDFLELNLIKCKHKLDAWKNESGRNSMTNQLIKKNFNTLVVNDDGRSFKMSEWKYSETYAFGNQLKLLISDKHTRVYQNSNEQTKKIIEKNNWEE